MNNIVHIDLSLIDKEIESLHSQLDKLKDLRDDILKYTIKEQPSPKVELAKPIANKTVTTPDNESSSAGVTDFILTILNGEEKTTRDIVEKYAIVANKPPKEAGKIISRAIHRLHSINKIATRPIIPGNRREGSYVKKLQNSENEKATGVETDG